MNSTLFDGTSFQRVSCESESRGSHTQEAAIVYYLKGWGRLFQTGEVSERGF